MATPAPRSRPAYPLLVLVLALAAALLVPGAAGANPATSTVTTLHPDNPEAKGHFGAVVATDGYFVVIGAPREDGGGENAGAVYVFRRGTYADASTDGPWHQIARFVAPEPREGARFGAAVDVHRGAVVVGAPGAGRAYVFGLGPDAGAPTTLEVPADAPPRFGASVAIHRHWVVVAGFPRPDEPGLGGAYAYEGDGARAEWTLTDELTAPATEVAGFGADVDVIEMPGIDGPAGTAIVGGISTDGPGLAAVFHSKADGSWAVTRVLEPPEGRTGTGFGASVGLAEDGSVAVVGAPRAGLDDSGALHRYRALRGSFGEDAIRPGHEDGTALGMSLSVAGGRGTPGNGGDDLPEGVSIVAGVSGGEEDVGGFRVFTADGPSEGLLVAACADDDAFGRVLDHAGGVIVVGSPASPDAAYVLAADALPTDCVGTASAQRDGPEQGPAESTDEEPTGDASTPAEGDTLATEGHADSTGDSDSDGGNIFARAADAVADAVTSVGEAIADAAEAVVGLIPGVD